MNGNGIKNNSNITKGLATVFAIASGLAVGNLYWAQPLLAQITASMGVATSTGGLLVTATQVGYAIGILLLVPLGDILPRRRLIGVLMIFAVVALLSCAVAPSFAFLALGLASLGLVTVSGQIIVPLAGDLAKPEERGSVVGIVSSGITVGILFARFLSGMVAEFGGWRMIYISAACMNLIMAVVIIKSVPELPGKEKIAYHKLLASVVLTFKKYPIMPFILIQTGMVFGIAYNLFWTALTFLLSAAPFCYSTFQIGLVSMVGLVGAITGIGMGKLQDKGLGIPALGAFVCLAIVCMAASVFAAKSIVIVVIIGAFFSLATQGTWILCQTKLFELSEMERSRLNTAFVVNNFVFCALGSSLSTVLWNLGGWQVVMIGACAATCLALIGWLIARKRLSK